jgi:hypothetical protein
LVFTILFAFLGVPLTVLAGASVAAVSLGYSALNAFLGCLVDPTSRLFFQTSPFTFRVNIMAFVTFNPALFGVSVLLSGVILTSAIYGVLAKPDDSRLICCLAAL